MTASVAFLAASRGKRVLLVEVDSKGNLTALFEHGPVGFAPVQVHPGVFVMQAVARWGNFFNQELYGPPTNLPWGIAIDCAHRVAEYACPPGNAPSLANTTR